MQCSSIAEKRDEVRKGIEKEGKLSMIKLLYAKKGMKYGVELWDEFDKVRNENGARLREARGRGMGGEILKGRYI